MNEFRFDPDADTDQTYRRGSIKIAPRRLMDVFGPPLEADGYKVSGQYTFTDGAGNVFTVYDWKATTLFDDGSGEREELTPPTPEEFWGNWYPEALNIGGRAGGDLDAFRRWLMEQTA